MISLVSLVNVKTSAEVHKVHWDLRDQYLDWAENWFPATDVRDRPQTLAQWTQRTKKER
jgi:hypothetical protein